MNQNRSLIAVLLISLFSLTAIQGINILLNQNKILGENTGVGSSQPNPPPRCIESKGVCSLNCKTGEKPVPSSDCTPKICCTLLVNQTPTPKTTITPPGQLNIPCSEIEKIQQLYCRNNSPLNPTPTSSTGIGSPCISNGQRRCQNQIVLVCLNYVWKLGETCEKSCSEGRCVNPTGTNIPTRSPSPTYRPGQPTATPAPPPP